MAGSPPQQPYPSRPPSQPMWPQQPYQPGAPSQPLGGFPPPPYYAPFPAPPRHQDNRRLVIGGLVVLAVLIALSGVVFVVRPLVQTITTPTSWVYGDDDLAVYISWTEQHGALRGTYLETYYIAQARPPSPAVRTESDGFTGNRNGSQVTLTFIGSGDSMTGTLGLRTLSLERPDRSTGDIQAITLRPGSAAEYDTAATKIRQQHPTVVYSNSLIGTAAGWPNGRGCSQQTDGYHITANVSCYPNIYAQSDVTLSVEARQINGVINQTYGISFRRINTDDRYFFGIDGLGHWVFGKVVNGQGQRVVDFTPNPAIRRGLNQLNTLTVAANGRHFTFFVNGTRVGSRDDSSLASGLWGLAGEDGIEVVFTNFVMTATP
ncbi:MAG TPA: hypothetical protein VFU88_16105 [Ktedonobacterales bacterium]|nr:hypothetical protein [Ktedonobacterales bacterium]